MTQEPDISGGAYSIQAEFICYAFVIFPLDLPTTQKTSTQAVTKLYLFSHMYVETALISLSWGGNFWTL